MSKFCEWGFPMVLRLVVYNMWLEMVDWKVKTLQTTFFGFKICMKESAVKKICSIKKCISGVAIKADNVYSAGAKTFSLKLSD